MPKYLLFALLTIILTINQAFSQIPHELNYQGFISDAQNKPINDGDYSLSFSIWDTQTGGIQLWSETKNVTISNGYFNTKLGDVNPINILFDKKLWLEIKIGANTANDRISLASVPYSLNSVYADTAKYVKSSPITRPISPPISSNEILNKSVVRSINIYPVTGSDSVSIMQDRVYLVGGANTAIKQNKDSIIIISGGTGTLDIAYNGGGNGAGREIDAINGSVNIKGEDGLEVYGTKHVFSASTHDNINAATISNYGSGNAIEATISSNQSSKSALLALSAGNDSSTAITGHVLATGNGIAGKFYTEETTNSANTLEAWHKGEGNAIFANVIGQKAYAGLFEQVHPDNTANAVRAINKGKGDGIFGISGDIPQRYTGLHGGGVVGISKNKIGVFGASDTSAGVYGITGKTGTFYSNGVWDIDAGVVGYTANVSDPDNFGVAGVASGYGTGMLGIGAGEGHGVIGVSGTASLETSAALRGITREDSAGTAAWPPYFTLHEDRNFGKGKIGVLGQSVKRYAVWGETISGVGIVGSIGKRMKDSFLPSKKAGIVGVSFLSDAPAIYSSADSNSAGFFLISNQSNNYPALHAENSGKGSAIYASNFNSQGKIAHFFGGNVSGDSIGVLIENLSRNDALVVNANGPAGRAAHLKTNDTSNNSISLKVTNYGKNDAAYFLIPNVNNSRVAMYAETFGFGYSGIFKQNNPQNTNSSVMIENYGIGRALEISNKAANGNGTALTIFQDGLGRGAEIQVQSTGNAQSALYVGNSGLGRAGDFIISNANNTNTVLVASQQGKGRAIAASISNAANNEGAIYASTTGTGRAGEFDIFNANSTNQALFAYTEGRGNAAYLFLNNPQSNANAVVVNANNANWALSVGNSGPNNNAGYFSGRVTVTGILSKGGGSFKIDHPLDPENKYLSHSFVESPDMKNIYDGIALLDSDGKAEVELPDWFGALNKDFRYQLTPIGASAPDLYISEEVKDNKFSISGGKPGLKVSWQVTGIRKDKFAEANRIIVEEDKPYEERGKYLHPEAFGMNKININSPMQSTDRPSQIIE